MAEEKKYDIVIIGAGPGGLTAGLYGARARRKTIALEKFTPGGQIANTEDIEDYPGFERISGAELAMKMADQARKFGLEIEAEEVLEIYIDGDDRVVRCASGNSYRAHAVILSTGGSPVKLKVPGEIEYTGKGVSYCAICDGAFFRDQVIAVVGGGDAAVEEAGFLTKLVPKYISSIAGTNSGLRKLFSKELLPIPKSRSSGIAWLRPSTATTSRLTAFL